MDSGWTVGVGGRGDRSSGQPPVTAERERPPRVRTGTRQERGRLSPAEELGVEPDGSGQEHGGSRGPGGPERAALPTCLRARVTWAFIGILYNAWKTRS